MTLLLLLITASILNIVALIRAFYLRDSLLLGVFTTALACTGMAWLMGGLVCLLRA